jgi:hypothetical protein
MAWHHFYALAEQAGEKLASVRMSEQEEAFEGLRPKKTRQHLEALSKLQERQAHLDSDSARVGAGFVRDSRGENALSKLSRYETALDRNLWRTLHELQRLQAARQGKNVLVPVVVDIDVSGAEPRLVDGVDSQSA